MQPFTLNIHGRIHRFDEPVVMGIVNLTTDSFFASSRAVQDDDIRRHVRELIDGGASIIDLGAYSSRPGTGIHRTDALAEYTMLARGIEAVRSIAPDILISVDTFRAEIAQKTVTQLGADIINDISAMQGDPDMLHVVTETHTPYILMHMRGTPDTMQQMCQYPQGQVAATVISELSRPLRLLEQAGVSDVIIDPGFGFAKTPEQCYELLRDLPAIATLGYPLLVGLSRKSMITRPLGITTDQALPATTAANALAIERGASILRVHDAREAVQAIRLTQLLNK